MNETKEARKKIPVDLRVGRYGVVAITKQWLVCLQKMDEGKGLNQSELVKKALDDIYTGTITEEDIEKAKIKYKVEIAADEESKRKRIEKEKNEAL